MTIGYWSEVPGKGAVTFNMIATALSMSAKCKERLILMQGKYDYNRIDYAFTPFMEDNMMREDYDYYNYGGMDNIINRLEHHVLSTGDIEKELIRVDDSNVYYLPATRQRIRELFDRRFMKVSGQYIRILNKFDEDTVILIELESGPENIAEDVLKALDVLVINISQGNNPVGRIGDNRAIMENSVFIVGRYDEASQFNVRNIYRKYHIDAERIGVVPYNIQLKDAMTLGKSREFFERNEGIGKENDNYIFMKYLDNTTDMIIKRCGLGVYG